MNYPETLKQLCSIPAPSGFETPAAQAALELLRPLVDEAWIDKMGVCIYRRGTDSTAVAMPSRMICMGQPLVPEEPAITSY